MPAPLGNINALKWTKELVEDLLSKVENLANEESVLYLGHAMTLMNSSTKQWRRIREYYDDDMELAERMDAVEEKFIARLTVGALTGKLRANTVHFILKNTEEYSRPKVEEAAPHTYSLEEPKSPQEYTARRKYILNRAKALAIAMKWNEEHPDEHQIDIEHSEYVHEPKEPCIKLMEGVYMQL